jgi:hypothetical protein
MCVDRLVLPMQHCKCCLHTMHGTCCNCDISAFNPKPYMLLLLLQACPLRSLSPVVLLLQRCGPCPTSQGCLPGTSTQHTHQLLLLLRKPVDAVCCYNRWALGKQHSYRRRKFQIFVGVLYSVCTRVLLASLCVLLSWRDMA